MNVEASDLLSPRRQKIWWCDRGPALAVYIQWRTPPIAGHKVMPSTCTSDCIIWACSLGQLLAKNPRSESCDKLAAFSSLHNTENGLQYWLIEEIYKHEWRWTQQISVSILWQCTMICAIIPRIDLVIPHPSSETSEQLAVGIKTSI